MKLRRALESPRAAVAVLLALALVTGFFATRWLLFHDGNDAVAMLTAKTGQTDRDTGKTVGAWRAADLSAEFFVGDGVRTGKESTATLTLSDRSALRLESSTLIRFLDRPSPKSPQRVDLQMGEAVLEAGGSDVILDTDIGVAVLGRGGKMSLKKVDGGTRYEVTVGKARFEGKDGEKTDVAAGESVVIGIGAAKLERYVPLPTASTAPAAATSPPPGPSAEPTTAVDGDIAAHVTGGGAVVRIPGKTQLEKLAPGDARVVAGSTLRLSTGTSADVSRGAERVTLHGQGEFIVGQAGKPFIVTQGGGVSLSGAETQVEIAVPGGSIVARLGARGEVGVSRDASRVTVTAGTVELRGAAATEELGAGEEGTLGKKGAEVQGRGPSYADLVVPAGASFAVHDPSPPTAVGFSTAGKCAEGATVQLAGGPRIRSSTSGAVNVLVAPGAHHYTVRCVGGSEKDVVATGTVSVLADGGTARIPRTAPATLVDTDGRSYTVLYQNLLPKITVRWPAAPQASSYTLRVTSPGGKSEAIPTSTASHAFPSGAFREGEHRVSFEGGGARAKDTRVEIKFDNAAPTATLTSPANGGFAPGGSVTVSGIALEGWKISVGGKELPLDDQLRFSGEATAPANQRALAIEFVHPRRGLHYYLRRASP
jgi:ferric-dicitrate binding protein FerR (iron transport regulator)